MQGVFTTEDMELDSTGVATHLWSIPQNFSSSSTIKLEVSSPRVSRDNNMMELGKKLLLKSKLGRTDEVKELMSRGAPFTADWVGTSPLHWAAYFNHVEVTDLLLKAGISRDARNKVDRTPLHVAAQKGHLQVVQLLLQYGADVNCKDMLRMTPLHWAAESGCADCIQTLIDYGADVHALNKFDKNPAKVATDNNHFHIAHLIEAAAALEPSVRSAKRNVVRQNVKPVKQNRPVTEHGVTQTLGPVLKTIGRRKKIGIVVTKSDSLDMETNSSDTNNLPDNSLSSNNTLELLQAHGITMLEPDNGTVVSSAVESGQTVMLTEAGKLALDLSKINSNEASQLHSKLPLSPKILSNAKKVITIRADQLINMTKEKKVIIKQGKPLQSTKVFQGKIYSPNQDEVVERLTNKMNEANRQAELFRVQMEKKEREAEVYKRQLESITSARKKPT